MPERTAHRNMRGLLANPRLASESGVALPAAIIVLFIVTLLSAAAVSVAVSTSTSTTRDANRKEALQAGETAVRVATYRLTMVKPYVNAAAPTEKPTCVGTASTEESPAANGYCESKKEGLGNGAEYKFWTSPVLDSKGECVGAVVTNTTATEEVAQRCVVGEGFVNGVRRRVAARVATFVATPLFPVKGVTGLKNVTINGTDNVISALGSNAKITGVGKDTGSGEVILGPSGSYSLPEGFQVTGVKAEPSPIVLAPVAPKNSATVNSNWEVAECAKLGFCGGNVNYESASRSLSITGNAWLTIGSDVEKGGTGIYNFCSLSAGANAILTIATGASVEIIIDSPEDPGSGCPKGTGTFSFNGSLINSGSPTALKIFIYGKAEALYAGKVNANATIFAPEAKIDLQGNSTLTGGIAGNEIQIGGNFSFTWDKEEEKLIAEPVAEYYRTAWQECTSPGNELTPEKGC